MTPRIVITKLARNVFEVRLHNGDDVHYFASFNISVKRWGRLLKASMLNVRRDAPIFLGEYWWRAFAAQHFPRARWATYSRMTKRGEAWREPIALKPSRPTLAQHIKGALTLYAALIYRGFPAISPRMAAVI